MCILQNVSADKFSNLIVVDEVVESSLDVGESIWCCGQGQVLGPISLQDVGDLSHFLFHFFLTVRPDNSFLLKMSVPITFGVLHSEPVPTTNYKDGSNPAKAQKIPCRGRY